MAVFRVERNRGYTVMSNHHLRNKELSLKAKGLLSQMLSLPEDWDYTLVGLSQSNRESIDAIRTVVRELEKAGYIKRRQGRDEKGKMTAIEYTIYEQPQPPEDTPPGLDKPILENLTPGNPILENPTPGYPTTENPMQLNKDIQKTDLPKKEKIITDSQSTDSIPILSPNNVVNLSRKSGNYKFMRMQKPFVIPWWLTFLLKCLSGRIMDLTFLTRWINCCSLSL